MLVLLTVNAQAQITIRAQQVPHTVGQQFQYYAESGDSILVNIGTTGGPQVWDFISGSTAFISTDLYLDPSTAPPQYSRANTVIQTDQLAMAGLNEPGIMYCYLHPTRFIFGAVETEYEGETFDFMFTPYITQYTLPLQMGSSWSNNIDVDEQFTIPGIGDIRLELSSTLNSQVDAYGTVQVPWGDFECLRIRNDVSYNLTISIWVLFVWVPVLEESGNAVNYDWRAPDVGMVLNVMAEGTNPNFSYAQTVRRLMNSSMVAGEELAAGLGVDQTAESFQLLDSYPNPFNNETVIAYELFEAANVDLRVVDILGRQVAVLDQGYRTEGMNELHWRPENLSAGVYFVMLTADNQVQQQMVLYLK